MGEGLDESLRRRVETLLEKMNQMIQREMFWVLKMAVRWCVYVVVMSLCFHVAFLMTTLASDSLCCLFAVVRHF